MDPLGQGFSASAFDFVIASNVLHATRDLRETLAHCRALLVPSGQLVALEHLSRQGWLDLTFGMLEGWWRFDDNYREESALAGEFAWRRALEESGFTHVAVLGPADCRSPAAIIASNPATVTDAPGLWLLASDAARDATELATRLSECNQSVVVASERDDGEAEFEDAGVVVKPLDFRRRDAWRRLLDELPENPPLQGVVHLSALKGSGTQASPAEMAEDTTRMAAGALALTQGMLAAGVVPARGVWFVTRGSQVVGAERGDQLAGSTLWGLGKTAALEAAELQPRMIDLDPGKPGSLCDIAEDLLYPDRETHVAHRSGTRFAARLSRLWADADRLRPPHHPNWRVVGDESGALDCLGVEPTELRSPGKGEVRVEVAAAGLNFYDVFVATGIIDPGRPLGVEFCGTVESVGPESEGVAAGDLVAGFALGAFGPRVVTRAELVTPVPQRVTAVSAATLPVAFVTVDLAFGIEGLAPGERVLIHAAAGGVGQAAIQLAHAAGAQVFATASAPKQDYVRTLGVSHVFDSRSVGFAAAILDATGGAGVTFVLNSLTGEGFIEESLSCLQKGGRFVELGKRGIWSPEEMAIARPDVDYRILALNRLFADDAPRVGASLRRVMARVEAGDCEPLERTAWPVTHAVGAMRHMRAGKHRGKIVLTMPRLASGTLREDATYLVTGGLGGIGRLVAGWLVEHGARSIVLNGRTEPDGAARAAIDALRQHGASVRIELADVTDPVAVDGLLERIEAALPPLAGVIHSVGILSDGSLENQDWKRFERALWPKVMGAWNLHRATVSKDLDLFVLFSSVSGVLGNVGQANHAAANAFLDQLARHRRASGLAGQSIAWGAWSEIGAAEEQRERIERRMESIGVRWITPKQGLGAFNELVREDVPAGLAADMDWGAFVKRAVKAAPFLEEVVSHGEGRSTVAAVSRGKLSKRLRQASAADREALLESFVRQELQAVLRLASPPRAAAGFFDLGMDSLMAVEFTNRLNKALAGQYVLAGTVVFSFSNATGLARHLTEELGKAYGEAQPPQLPVPDRPSGDSDESEDERIRSLSEQDFLEEAMAALGVEELEQPE